MIRLAILISGSGTTAAAILEACKKGKLPGIKPVVVISSKADALGLKKANAYQIDTAVVNPKDYADKGEFGKALLNVLTKNQVDIVSQNGWLPLMPSACIDAFKGKIINQHPGPLDPGHEDFGGKGMFGKRVTAARVAYAWMSGEESWTEATTHHVTTEYDKGLVIRTEKLDIPPIDHPVTEAELHNNPQQLIDATHAVAAQLLPLEHKNVIATLHSYAREARFASQSRQKRIVPPGHKHLIVKAKELAFALFPKG